MRKLDPSDVKGNWTIILVKTLEPAAKSILLRIVTVICPIMKFTGTYRDRRSIIDQLSLESAREQLIL